MEVSGEPEVVGTSSLSPLGVATGSGATLGRADPEPPITLASHRTPMDDDRAGDDDEDARYAAMLEEAVDRLDEMRQTMGGATSIECRLDWSQAERQLWRRKRWAVAAEMGQAPLCAGCGTTLATEGYLCRYCQSGEKCFTCTAVCCRERRAGMSPEEVAERQSLREWWMTCEALTPSWTSPKPRGSRELRSLRRRQMRTSETWATGWGPSLSTSRWREARGRTPLCFPRARRTRQRCWLRSGGWRRKESSSSSRTGIVDQGHL